MIPQHRTGDPVTSKLNYNPDLQLAVTAAVRAIMADGVPRAAHEIVVPGFTDGRVRHGMRALKVAGEIVETGERRATGVGSGRGAVYQWTMAACVKGCV